MKGKGGGQSPRGLAAIGRLCGCVEMTRLLKWGDSLSFPLIHLYEEDKMAPRDASLIRKPRDGNNHHEATTMT